MKGGLVGDRDRDQVLRQPRVGRASMKGGLVGDRDFPSMLSPRYHSTASMKGGLVGDRDQADKKKRYPLDTPR